MADQLNQDAGNKTQDGDKAPEELRTLKSELEQHRGKIKTYETDIAHLQRKIETLTEAKGERDKMVEDKAKGGDPEALERIKQTLRDEFAASEESLKKSNQTLEQELKQERVIGKAMTKAAGLFNQDALEFIQIKVQKDCDYKDGQIVVKDEKGEPRYSEKNRRELMSVDEYLEELTNKHPSLAKATSNSGTKDPGEKRNGHYSTLTYEQYSRLSSAEQQKLNIDPKIAREWLSNRNFRRN